MNYSKEVLAISSQIAQTFGTSKESILYEAEQLAYAFSDKGIDQYEKDKQKKG